MEDTAEWDPSGFYFGDSKVPASGEDFIGFPWGGGFDYSSHRISGEYSKRIKDLDFYKADLSPNTGYVWSFDESYRTPSGNTYYAEEIKSRIDIYKNTLTGRGNTTSAILKYIHTYQGRTGGISISASPSGVGAGFLLNSTRKQWSIICDVSKLKY